MAENLGANIRPPKYLSITNDQNMTVAWKEWMQQFQWYSTATKLKEKEPKIQVAIFMSTIGPDAIKIFNTFKLTDAQGNDLEIIKQKFEEHFVPKINITYERYVFNRTYQKAGETFDEFLTEIRNKCKNCAFGTLDSSLLCDKIVIGIQSDQLRERLLSEEKLTLQKAIDICRANEQAKIQLLNMKEKETNKIDVIKTFNKYNKKGSKNTILKSENELFDCKRCATKHGKASCPAYMKKCKKCQKMGHFSKCCRTKKVQSVGLSINNNTDSDGEVMYVSEVKASEQNDWFEKIILPNNQQISFKLDSGAQCNVISTQMAKRSKLTVNNSNVKQLQSFSNHTVEVKGEATATVIVKSISQSIKFIVVEGDVQPILGKQTCVQLGLIKRIDMMNTGTKNLFEGIGCLKGFKYEIDLIDNPMLPICAARRIPYALRDDVKRELDNMTREGVIEPINEPTPAVSPMVIVRQNNKLRICLDPSAINKNLKRRHYPLNTLEEIAARINGSKWFTLLDCKKGFWQLEVTDRTARYLTFATPWGRYLCRRMPFGLASAPEVFQQIMCTLLKGIKNVECAMDDILIHASTKEQLEKITAEVLSKINKAGLTLNSDKCQFIKQRVKFLGHILTDEGLLPDERKIETISRIKQPTCIKELQRFLGMVTYLGKFIKNLAELTAPLRTLLIKDNEWLWDDEKTQAIENIKDCLKKPPVLGYYNPQKPVLLSVDASKDAVGAVMMQDNRPIAYSAKSLTKSQLNWSQLEKEAFAILVACNKFKEYVWGNRELIVESDHKPLETIFKKPLNEAPPRLQRILFEVVPFNPKVIYKKGSELYIADTLSRDVNNKPSEDEQSTLQIHVLIPMSKNRLMELRKAISEEEELQILKNTVQHGWPDSQKKLPKSLLKYWPYREQLSYVEDILLKNDRILIPPSMTKLVMQNSHKSHKAIEGTLKLAKDYVFWPSMRADITNFVKNCKVCQHLQKDNPQEKILMQEAPKRPWEHVASDIFHLKNNDYLVIADGYSGFFDYVQLGRITSTAVIRAFKTWFATLGIPDVLSTDGGAQFTSREFEIFAEEWQVELRKSSPNFPRSNGLAERYVQEGKNLLAKCLEEGSDVQLALLHHRNTPRGDLGSPAQRLMGRRTRSTLPTTEKLLMPKLIENVSQKLQKIKEMEKVQADKGKKPPSQFKEGEQVLYRQDHKNWLPAQVINTTKEPRSFIIQTPEGVQYRRNSWFLKHANTPCKNGEHPAEEPTLENKTSAYSPIQTTSDEQDDQIQKDVPVGIEPLATPVKTSRAGRVIKAPKRLDI